MTNKRLLGILTSLGLREPEATLYLASLNLGPTTILKLAQASDLKRTTIYTLMEALQKKGLMRQEIRGLKTLFVANHPNHLEHVFRQQEEGLRDALPELESLYQLGGDEGALKYYEGLTGIKTLYEEALRDIRAREDYLVMTDLEAWLRLDPDYFLKFIEKRAKLPIKIRILAQDSATARTHKRLEKTYREEIRILPPQTKLTTNLIILPKRVVIHQLIHPISAIVIEHKSVIQMHREQFEIIWNTATRTSYEGK